MFETELWANKPLTKKPTPTNKHQYHNRYFNSIMFKLTPAEKEKQKKRSRNFLPAIEKK